MTPPLSSRHGSRKFQLTLDESDLYLIMQALNLKITLNVGQTANAFSELPIDYEKYYKVPYWNDWNLTKEVIRQLISDFTIENVDGYHRSLSVEGPEVSSACKRCYKLYSMIKQAINEDFLIKGVITHATPSPCATLDESTSNYTCNDDQHQGHT